MNKHTPGPWRFGKNSDDVVADTSGGHDDPHGIDYYGGHLIAESIHSKNRDIIAAAPELLEALEVLKDAFIVAVGATSPYAKEALRRPMAAIAKARGEE